MSVPLLAIGSVLLVSLVSLVGVLTLSVRAARLERVVFLLVSFAVGAMLGSALLHLIPEAYELLGNGTLVGALVLAGVLGFFVLEKFLHWRHDHDVQHTHGVEHAEDALQAHLPATPIRSFAVMNLAGDFAHNVLDGMVIAGAYLVSVPTGLATTAAVLLHELPQEMGDFGVLVFGGLSPRKALLYNFGTALGAVLGAAIALFVGSQVEGFAAYLLPLTAGTFLYIAGSDLIPELHQHHSTPATKSVGQFVMILLGMLVMALPLLLGHSH